MERRARIIVDVTYPESWDENEDIGALGSAISNLEYDGFTIEGAKESAR